MFIILNYYLDFKQFCFVFQKGLEIIFRMALALLEFHKDNLLLLDMEGLLKVRFLILFKYN
jgi:hypothetical protein